MMWDMMTKIILSICIPVYNDVRNINASISSCVNQLIPGVELLILDNCSTDGTYECAKKYEGDKVRVLQNSKNLGAYGNHNMAMNLATGKYIKFLHSDDTLHPKGVSLIFNEIKQHPELDFFSFNANFKNTLGAVTLRNEYKYDIILNELSPEIFIKYGSFLGTPSMTFFKKSIIEKIGWFDVLMEPSGDGEYWDRVLENCNIKLCHSILVTISDDPVTSMQAYNLNKRFYEALMRRLDKISQRNNSDAFQLRVSEFKYRMLLQHLKLAIRFSLLTFQPAYFTLVMCDLIKIIWNYKFKEGGKLKNLQSRLPENWYDELAREDSA